MTIQKKKQIKLKLSSINISNFCIIYSNLKCFSEIIGYFLLIFNWQLISFNFYMLLQRLLKVFWLVTTTLKDLLCSSFFVSCGKLIVGIAPSFRIFFPVSEEKYKQTFISFSSSIFIQSNIYI